MKISFLRNMSHEIRTPLNIISGYAQIISDPRTLTSDAERAEIAKRIGHSTDTIVRIVSISPARRAFTISTSPTS